MVSRRAFLTGSATFLAGLGLTPAWAGPPVELNRALFEGLEGSMFAVLAGYRVSYVALSEVRDASSDPNLDQFTLVFDLVDGPVPSSDMHNVWHMNVGVFALRLDASDETSGRYVAPFSLPAS